MVLTFRCDSPRSERKDSGEFTRKGGSRHVGWSTAHLHMLSFEIVAHLCSSSR